MRLSRFYTHKVHEFEFRIFRVKTGKWTARCRFLHYSIWRAVRYPSRHVLRETAKKHVISYLNYAYGNHETP